MTFTKIKLTLQSLGLAFILPLAGATALCAVALGYAVHQYGIISAGALITLACLLGFVLVLALPAVVFYTRFYGRIDGIVGLLDGIKVYVISNGLLSHVNSIAVENTLTECLRRATMVFQDASYCALRGAIKRPLDNMIIIFTHDINEAQYYQRWGIRYTRIRGLKMGNRILVEKRHDETVDATALDHEIFHVIVDAHASPLRSMGRLHEVEDALGLEHRNL